jgi:hypothetical protein
MTLLQRCRADDSARSTATMRAEREDGMRFVKRA